jgi:2-keto-4-pentenoate hydratase
MGDLEKELAKAWINKSLINLNNIDKINIPNSREEAYSVLNNFYKILNKKTVGWKIGAVAKEVQKEEGFDGPVPGRIFQESILKPGSSINYSNIPYSNLECEFAFKFTKNVNIKSGLEKDLKNLQLFTAIDITSSRYQAKSKLNFSKLIQMYLGIADHGNGGRIIIGDEIKDWQNIRLNDLKIKLNINGKETKPFFTGTKRIHPIDSLKAFIDEFKDKNYVFKANDLLLCGSLTEPYNIKKNDYINIEYENLNKLEVFIK